MVDFSVLKQCDFIFILKLGSFTLSLKEVYEKVVSLRLLVSEADYTKVTDADIHSDALFLRCEVPVPNSVLNKVNNKSMFNEFDIVYLSAFVSL